MKAAYELTNTNCSTVPRRTRPDRKLQATIPVAAVPRQNGCHHHMIAASSMSAHSSYNPPPFPCTLSPYPANTTLPPRAPASNRAPPAWIASMIKTASRLHAIMTPGVDMHSCKTT